MNSNAFVTGLVNKRSKLIDYKHKLQNDFDKQILEVDKQISNINDVLNQVNALMEDYICPSCKGSGEHSFTDAAGGRDYEDCPRCKGTGFVFDKKK